MNENGVMGVDAASTRSGAPGPSLRSRLWKWTKRLVTGCVVLLAVLAIGGAVYQAVATWSGDRGFPPPGRMVDVGGYRLHLLCRGKGEPTVVLDQVLGEGSMGWSLLQGDIAGFTQVCAFDRAGYGWSDPGPKLRTSGQIVTELHALLEKAGLPEPYVLVGASFGGGNAQLYALRYPNQVAGLVLVDSVHEDQTARLPPSAGASGPPLGVLRLFQVAAHLGILRLADMPIGIASMGILPNDLQPAARAVAFKASLVDTIYQETAAVEQSLTELRTAKQAAGEIPFGSLPVVVLTHRESRELTQDESAAYSVWLQLQSELAESSSVGRQVIVEDSGHFVGLDQPAKVVEAVRSLVGELQGSSARSTSSCDSQTRAAQPPPSNRVSTARSRSSARVMKPRASSTLCTIRRPPSNMLVEGKASRRSGRFERFPCEE